MQTVTNQQIGILSSTSNKFEYYYYDLIKHEDNLYSAIIIDLSNRKYRAIAIDKSWMDIATQFYRQKLCGVIPDNIAWYEFYPKRKRGQGNDIFDKIVLKFYKTWSGTQFAAPEWIKIKLESLSFKNLKERANWKWFDL